MDQIARRYGGWPDHMDEVAYAAAILRCAENILPMHMGERLINKIFGKSLQSHAAGLLAILHCRAQLGEGEAPTLSALQQHMGRSRTLASFIGLLKLAGYVRAAEAPGDRREKRLEPSDLLLDGLKTWLSHHLACAEAAGMPLPSPGLDLRLRAEPAYALCFIAETHDMVRLTREALAGEGPWPWFDRFDCGDRLALVLLKGHYVQGMDDVWQPFAARHAAAQLGISHSHVRNVINRAEEAGWLLQRRDQGALQLTPAFLTGVRDWYLMFWGWLCEAAHRAHAREADLAEA